MNVGAKSALKYATDRQNQEKAIVVHADHVFALESDFRSSNGLPKTSKLANGVSWNLKESVLPAVKLTHDKNLSIPNSSRKLHCLTTVELNQQRKIYSKPISRGLAARFERSDEMLKEHCQTDSAKAGDKKSEPAILETRERQTITPNWLHRFSLP